MENIVKMAICSLFIHALVAGRKCNFKIMQNVKPPSHVDKDYKDRTAFLKVDPGKTG